MSDPNTPSSSDNPEDTNAANLPPEPPTNPNQSGYVPPPLDVPETVYATYTQPPSAPSGYGTPPVGPPQHSGYAPQPYVGSKPESNLVWAILATVLCCVPFGVVSIVYAAKVDSLWTAGDHAGSREASEKAKKWAIISAVTSLVLIVLYIIGVVALGVSMDSSDPSPTYSNNY